MRWPAVLLTVMVTPLMALAHAVIVQVKIEADRVTVEASYDDETPAEEATITVKDTAGQVVATGQTDDRGLWRFPRPKPGEYVVMADAGAGHVKQVTVTIPVDDTPLSPTPPARQWSRWLVSLAGVVIIIGLTIAWQQWKRRNARKSG